MLCIESVAVGGNLLVFVVRTLQCRGIKRCDSYISFLTFFLTAEVQREVAEIDVLGIGFGGQDVPCRLVGHIDVEGDAFSVGCQCGIAIFGILLLEVIVFQSAFATTESGTVAADGVNLVDIGKEQSLCSRLLRLGTCRRTRSGGGVERHVIITALVCRSFDEEVVRVATRGSGVVLLCSFGIPLGTLLIVGVFEHHGTFIIAGGYEQRYLIATIEQVVLRREAGVVDFCSIAELAGHRKVLQLGVEWQQLQIDGIERAVARGKPLDVEVDGIVVEVFQRHALCRILFSQVQSQGCHRLIVAGVRGYDEAAFFYGGVGFVAAGFGQAPTAVVGQVIGSIPNVPIVFIVESIGLIPRPAAGILI